jgi:lysophospholipase L1-like esterase
MSRLTSITFFFPYIETISDLFSTPLHHPYSVSLVNQILQWSKYALPVLKPNLSKTLVAVWIGINDIGDSAKYTFPRNNTNNFEEFYSAIISTEFQALETLWEAGYTNYLFMNLPPLERTVRYILL